MKIQRRIVIIKIFLIALMVMLARMPSAAAVSFSEIKVQTPFPIYPAPEPGLEITDISVAGLQKLHQDYGYNKLVPKAVYKVPAIFLKNLPTDYDKITDDNLRNTIFIKTLAPLALKVNEGILQERAEVEQWVADFDENGELNAEQVKNLEAMATKYNIFYRMQGARRYKAILSELLRRVDALPASAYIAIAAIETNWGQSRIVKEGHSLFKELAWYTDEGLIPADETEDKNYRIKIFPTLQAAMEAWALKINSSINFESLRGYRKALRYRSSPFDGRTMVFTFFQQSALPNYVGLLDYTITFYELDYIDISTLDYDVIKKSKKRIVTKT